MTNQDHFSICRPGSWTIDTECPICGDRFTPSDYMVFDGNDVPLCYMCGWDKAPGLANLLSLSYDLNRYYQAEPPADVYEALKRRESDPKRLKKELQKDHDSISSNGPLAEFLKEQLKVALDGKNVEKLKKAKLLFEETKRGISTHPYSSEYQSDLDAEIPF